MPSRAQSGWRRWSEARLLCRAASVCDGRGGRIASQPQRPPCSSRYGRGSREEPKEEGKLGMQPAMRVYAAAPLLACGGRVGEVTSSGHVALERACCGSERTGTRSPSPPETLRLPAGALAHLGSIGIETHRARRRLSVSSYRLSREARIGFLTWEAKKSRVRSLQTRPRRSFRMPQGNEERSKERAHGN